MNASKHDTSQVKIRKADGTRAIYCHGPAFNRLVCFSGFDYVLNKFSKIYLASRYSRREELCKYRKSLQVLGFTITSRWLNGKHQINESGEPIGEEGEKLVEAGFDNRSAELRTRFASEDVADVLEADTIISFTEPPRSNASRGGRHVEFGIGLATNKNLIVIGHRENLFHWVPKVTFFETWEKFLDEIF